MRASRARARPFGARWRRHASGNIERSPAPSTSETTTPLPVGTSGPASSTPRRPSPSAASRPAPSAPRLPSQRASAPSIAAQAATLAPCPPAEREIAAAVSAPRAISPSIRRPRRAARSPRARRARPTILHGARRRDIVHCRRPGRRSCSAGSSAPPRSRRRSGARGVGGAGRCSGLARVRAGARATARCRGDGEQRAVRARPQRTAGTTV